MTDQNKFTEVSVNNLSLLEQILQRLDGIESRLNDLEKKRQADTKRYNINAAKFSEFKSDFMASNPHSRTDAFSVEELVLWASYIRKDSPRKEVLNHTEFFKRIKSIRRVIAYYKEHYIGKGQSEQDAEINAHYRTRDYLEFTILSVKIQGEHIGFWQATSEWALNQFGMEVASWQKYKDLEDIPL